MVFIPATDDGKRIYVGSYGSTYICDERGCVYDIQSCDKDKKQITTKTGKVIQVVGEPDYDLFMDILGNEWDLFGKEMWNEDEDRTDYVPYYYKTFDDYLKQKSSKHNGYHLSATSD